MQSLPPIQIMRQLQALGSLAKRAGGGSQVPDAEGWGLDLYEIGHILMDRQGSCGKR